MQFSVNKSVTISFIKLSDNVNMYNILEHNSNTDEKMRDQRELHSISKRHISVLHEDQLTELMNGQIKRKLNIPGKVTWGGIKAT